MERKALGGGVVCTAEIHKPPPFDPNGADTNQGEEIRGCRRYDGGGGVELLDTLDSPMKKVPETEHSLIFL